MLTLEIGAGVLLQLRDTGPETAAIDAYGFDFESQYLSFNLKLSCLQYCFLQN